jgi:hypothetical protein
MAGRLLCFTSRNKEINMATTSTRHLKLKMPESRRHLHATIYMR